MNAFVGALILCLPAAPFLLLCLRRGFIRRACMFRRAFLILIGGLAGYVSLVVVMAWLFPHLLLWLIAFAAPQFSTSFIGVRSHVSEPTGTSRRVRCSSPLRDHGATIYSISNRQNVLARFSK